MGSTESKSQSADTAASKPADQQENGHVKTNGDTLPKTNGDAAAANGSAEPVTEEVGSGETIEQAPPTNGEAKPEEPPGKAAKKKIFSFKKNIKLPFRKPKKEAPPAGEEAAAPKPEEEPKLAEATSETPEPAEEAAASPEQTPQSEESVPSTEAPAEPQKE
ncbi:MARCKS-related protein [Ranitomeya imitator]|uniref:MARCKS-related protein n=1 Tax=Ranitomeya imitator TaxID=111125 RepID=UPI0037E777DF